MLLFVNPVDFPHVNAAYVVFGHVHPLSKCPRGLLVAAFGPTIGCGEKGRLGRYLFYFQRDWLLLAIVIIVRNYTLLQADRVKVGVAVASCHAMGPPLTFGSRF